MKKRQLALMPGLGSDEQEGRVLTADERTRLRALVDRDGDVAVAKKMGCAKTTIVRALSSLRLQRGSVVLIRQGLTESAP